MNGKEIIFTHRNIVNFKNIYRDLEGLRKKLANIKACYVIIITIDFSMEYPDI